MIENSCPICNGLFVAFGLWFLAAVGGIAGLMGLLHHDRVGLFALSLLIAGFLGFIGASFT